MALDTEDPFDPAAQIWFSGELTSESPMFVLDAWAMGEERLPDDVYLHVFPMGGGGEPLQSVRFDSTCSTILTTGDRFGGFSVQAVEISD